MLVYIELLLLQQQKQPLQHAYNATAAGTGFLSSSSGRGVVVVLQIMTAAVAELVGYFTGFATGG